MTVATVTLYKENRLDQAQQCSPAQLAADFLATLRGGSTLSMSRRQPAYR